MVTLHVEGSPKRTHLIKSNHKGQKTYSCIVLRLNRIAHLKKKMASFFRLFSLKININPGREMSWGAAVWKGQQKTTLWKYFLRTK